MDWVLWTTYTGSKSHTMRRFLGVLVVLFLARNAAAIERGNEDPNKPVVRVVAHDRIRGFLNWLQEWFMDAARTKCPTTTCIDYREQN